MIRDDRSKCSSAERRYSQTLSDIIIISFSVLNYKVVSFSREKGICLALVIYINENNSI